MRGDFSFLTLWMELMTIPTTRCRTAGAEVNKIERLHLSRLDRRCLVLRSATFGPTLLVALLLVTSACAPQPAVLASPSTVPNPAVTASPTQPSTPAPSPSVGFSLENVKATALGRLTGDAALIIRSSLPSDVTGRPGSGDMRELVVVPLDGGPARIALSYRRRPGTLSDFESGPVVLARQLSADRRRVILDDVDLPRLPSATKINDPGQPLVIADLETGALRVLAITGVGVDAVDSAWSPSGDSIAFARRPLGAPRIGDDGVWLVGVDGSGLRRLTDPAPAPGYTFVHGWTADGRAVAFSIGVIRPDAPAGVTPTGMDYRLVDVTTRAVRKLDGYIETVAPGDWRVGSPAFVGTFTDDPPDISVSTTHYGGATRVVAADAAGQSVRTIFEQSIDQYGRPRLYQARWHPTADKLLVFVNDPGQNSVKLIDLTTGAVTVSGRGRAFRAEWAPSGDAMVLLVSTPPTAPTSVTIRSLDGTQERDLVPAAFEWVVLDLATVRYR
jgi:hypothetical protein